MAELTIFYDGGCPLCAAEMNHLRKLDSNDSIAYEDIYADGFEGRFPYIDLPQADRILHGELADGTIIYALDVTYEAWALVGKRHWVAILRWPLFKQVANLGYVFFARYRRSISSLISGQPRCDTCTVDNEPKP